MIQQDVIIYHNPDCGNSTRTLALIRQSGIEPHVVDYVKTPPSRRMLQTLAARMGTRIHTLLRDKDTPIVEYGLDAEGVSDDTVLSAMEAHPLFIHRPIVVTPKGVRICRPAEQVLDLIS